MEKSMEVNNQSKKIVKKSISKQKIIHLNDGHIKIWKTLEHNGLVFPPSYKPHGINILYDGKPVHLTPDQEEMATLYASMLDTDYVNIKIFNDNFFGDWKKLLGSKHVIKEFDKCDFRPIYEWISKEKEKEKKEHMSLNEKAALREEKRKEDEEYMAIVDGIKHKVSKLRIEPPSLYKGRGKNCTEMGKLRRRIYPSDVIINIGKGAPVPEPPAPGHSWKEVRHDQSVSWIACWNDPIHPREFKHAFWFSQTAFIKPVVVQKDEDSRNLMLKIMQSRCNRANMLDALKVTPKSCDGQTSAMKGALGLGSLKISDWEIVEKEDLGETASEPMIMNK